MAEEQPNQIAIGANLRVEQPHEVVANESARLMGEYMVPPVVESQSSIVYPTFGQANFHLRTDVINMFHNALQFFGRVLENPNAHVSRFLDMCATIEYPRVSSEAIRLRLFPYTLRDSAREWLDTCPPQSITSRNQLSQKFLSKYFPPKRITLLPLEVLCVVNIFH